MWKWRGSRKSRVLSAVFMAGAAVTMSCSGCSEQGMTGSTDEPGTVSIKADLSHTSITTLVITVAAADINPPLTFNVPVEDGVASGSITITSGVARTLTLQGFNTEGVETHRGVAVIDVQPGLNTPVELTLQPIGSVAALDVWELVVANTNAYSNPYDYQEVELSAVLQAPSGVQKTAFGFHDGDGAGGQTGTVWKLRFSPDEPGTWTYTYHWSDGTPGGTGQFESVPSDLRGALEADPAAPHHFRYGNGSPAWFLGDTQWRLMADDPGENLSRAAVEHHLNVRAAQGFNYVHSNTMNLSNAFGSPFVDIAQMVPNPGFWREVDHRVNFAGDLGLTLGLMLAWGVDPASVLDWSDFDSHPDQLAFARWFAARYSAYPVWFIVAGEWNEGGASRPEYIAIGDLISATDPHDRLITIHPDGKVEDFNDDSSWMGLGDYQQSYGDLYGGIIGARDRNKPVINAEYGYFLRDQNGDGIVDKPNSATREEFRYAAYEILMAGGYFVSGFGRSYFGGYRDPLTYSVDDERYDDAEADLQRMKELFESVNYRALQPNDLLVSGPGWFHCLAATGSQYVVYVRGTTDPVSLDLGGAPAGTYKIRRFDPRTGIESIEADYTGTGPVPLTPPSTEDHIFVVTRI